ncbi:hypothetical protein ACWGB8_21955 [Kitasatospora sp. NPDC054939]
MRNHTMKLTVAALAAATALSLTACGPENSDPAGGVAGPGGGTAPAASTPAGGGSAGGAGGSTASAPAGGTAGSTGGSTAGANGTGGAGGATPSASATGGAGAPQAATAVKYGQPATVDFADKNAKVATKLQITVTGVEVGSLAELTAAKVNTVGLDGRTPMYVRYTMQNVGDASLSFTAPDSKLVLFDNTGRKGLNVISAANPLPKCTGAKFQGFGKGSTVTGCVIIATTGTAPASVGYTDLTDNLKLQASWAK